MPLPPDDLQDRVDALLQANGFGLDRWEPAFGDAPLELTYRFETSLADDFPWDDVSAPVPFTQAHKAAFRAALDHYETVLNVVFTEDPAGADATISFYRADDLYTGSSLTGGGRGRFDFFWNTLNGARVYEWDGSAVFQSGFDLADEGATNLIVHEIGHALGLKHPGAYDVNADNIPPGPFLPTDEDNEKYSIMSYIESPDPTDQPQELMLYDIAALQAWWGANPTHNAGATRHLTNKSDLVEVIWDSGGIDELRHSGKTPAHLDLEPGAFSRIDGVETMAIAYGTIIENVTGGNGRDLLFGNDADNMIKGGRAPDQLRGSKGADTLKGGKSGDSLFGGAGKDVLEGGNGVDFVTGGKGADTFVIKAGSKRTVIRDFQDDVDTIQLDTDLWTGDLTKREVLEQFNGQKLFGIILDFGDVDLWIQGFDDLDALRDDLQLV